jgi:hypothetical protein
MSISALTLTPVAGMLCFDVRLGQCPDSRNLGVLGTSREHKKSSSKAALSTRLKCFEAALG